MFSMLPHPPIRRPTSLRLLLACLLLGAFSAALAGLPAAGLSAAGADPATGAAAERALAAAVAQGKRLWRKSWRSGAKACFACHQRGPNKMLGERLGGYPKYDKTLGKVVSARQKINHMIKSKSGGRKLDLASDDLTALEAFIKTLK